MHAATSNANCTAACVVWCCWLDTKRAPRQCVGRSNREFIHQSGSMNHHFSLTSLGGLQPAGTKSNFKQNASQWLHLLLLNRDDRRHRVPGADPGVAAHQGGDAGGGAPPKTASGTAAWVAPGRAHAAALAGWTLRAGGARVKGDARRGQSGAQAVHRGSRRSRRGPRVWVGSFRPASRLHRRGNFCTFTGMLKQLRVNCFSFLFEFWPDHRLIISMRYFIRCKYYFFSWILSLWFTVVKKWNFEKLVNIDYKKCSKIKRMKNLTGQLVRFWNARSFDLKHCSGMLNLVEFSKLLKLWNIKKTIRAALLLHVVWGAFLYVFFYIIKKIAKFSQNIKSNNKTQFHLKLSYLIN